MDSFIFYVLHDTRASFQTSVLALLSCVAHVRTLTLELCITRKVLITSAPVGCEVLR